MDHITTRGDYRHGGECAMQGAPAETVGAAQVCLALEMPALETRPPTHSRTEGATPVAAALASQESLSLRFPRNSFGGLTFGNAGDLGGGFSRSFLGDPAELGALGRSCLAGLGRSFLGNHAGLEDLGGGLSNGFGSLSGGFGNGLGGDLDGRLGRSYGRGPVPPLGPGLLEHSLANFLNLLGYLPAPGLRLIEQSHRHPLSFLRPAWVGGSTIDRAYLSAVLVAGANAVKRLWTELRVGWSAVPPSWRTRNPRQGVGVGWSSPTEAAVSRKGGRSATTTSCEWHRCFAGWRNG